MVRALTRLREGVLDAVDLAIDFATLGEYGLQAAEPAACEARGRSGVGLAAIDGRQHLAADLDRSGEHIGV